MGALKTLKEDSSSLSNAVTNSSWMAKERVYVCVCIVCGFAETWKWKKNNIFSTTRSIFPLNLFTFFIYNNQLNRFFLEFCERTTRQFYETDQNKISSWLASEMEVMTDKKI